MTTDSPRPDQAPWSTTADDAPTTVEAAKSSGGFSEFVVRPGAAVLCLTCRTEFAAADHAQADHMRRLEGASDPADELIIVDVVCPNCHATGTLTLSFGPEASPEDADVLSAIERRPAIPYLDNEH